ncbi:MAG: magnesium transporter, partial [Planctomycetes bacterium]|nr:magnesium transporter [Planctomycetota bacterium]
MRQTEHDRDENTLPATMPAYEAVRELTRLEPPEQAEIFEQIPEQQATAIFGLLDKGVQQQLVDRLPPAQVVRLVESLEPDDRAQLLEELPAPTARNLLSNLSPHERQMTAQLLGFPEESVGRIMTPEFLALGPGLTVAQALEKIRREGQAAETIYVLPLLDDEHHLLGLVYLKDLVLAPCDQLVDELADTMVRPLPALEDQEVAARLIQMTDTLAAPVVDKEGRLLGLVTVDDAMDVLDREVEEDLAWAGGSEPLARPYFSVSALRLARTRVIWLLALALAAILTVNVLSAFEATLEAVISLALFIPLLIDTGGNCGAQSATTLVRAMSVGEIGPQDLLRVLGRECLVGLLLGAMLAAIGVIPLW